MSDLKPCPFCGSEPVVEGNLVACNNLNCPTHDNYWTDPMIFTCDQWNTRPIEDALNARIAELEYQLEDWTNNGWAEDYKARIAELEAENETIISDYEERMDNLVNIGNETGRLLQAEIGYLNAQLGIKNLTTETLQLRIAELEGLVDELIEAGESMSIAVECENQIDANAYYSWKELVKDWKERER